MGALAAVGGTQGQASEHQCRFVQSFSEDAQLVDASVGLCVPTDLVGGGSWSDCREFAWEAIKAAWSDALTAGTDPQSAFNEFCLLEPADPDNSALKDVCVGLYRGCISLEEREMGLPGMTMGSTP